MFPRKKLYVVYECFILLGILRARWTKPYQIFRIGGTSSTNCKKFCWWSFNPTNHPILILSYLWSPFNRSFLLLDEMVIPSVKQTTQFLPYGWWLFMQDPEVSVCDVFENLLIRNSLWWSLNRYSSLLDDLVGPTVLHPHFHAIINLFFFTEVCYQPIAT